MVFLIHWYFWTLVFWALPVYIRDFFDVYEKVEFYKGAYKRKEKKSNQTSQERCMESSDSKTLLSSKLNSLNSKFGWWLIVLVFWLCLLVFCFISTCYKLVDILDIIILNPSLIYVIALLKMRVLWSLGKSWVLLGCSDT